MIQDEPQSGHSLKEIKVRIPVSFHLKLHAFKVLKGKPISDTIVEALDAYFKAAEHRKPGEAGAQPGAPEAHPPQQALGHDADEEPEGHPPVGAGHGPRRFL